MRVVQAVVSQVVCVAETLQDAVHEALRREKRVTIRKHSLTTDTQF